MKKIMQAITSVFVSNTRLYDLITEKREREVQETKKEIKKEVEEIERITKEIKKTTAYKIAKSTGNLKEI